MQSLLPPSDSSAICFSLFALHLSLLSGSGLIDGDMNPFYFLRTLIFVLFVTWKGLELYGLALSIQNRHRAGLES